MVRSRISVSLIYIAKIICFLIVGSVFISVLFQSLRKNPWSALMALACLGVLAVITYKKVEKVAFAALFGAMVATQLLLGILLAMDFKTWDVFTIIRTAKALSTGDEFNHIYFARYPNNIAIALLYSCVFRISNKLFGITPVYLLTLVNIAAIDLSIIFLISAVKRLTNERSAARAGIMATMFAPFYLYVPIPYTDTLAMAIFSALIYGITRAFLFGDQPFKTGALTVGCILLGATAAIGYEIKGSVLIILIALFISILVYFHPKKSLHILFSIGIGFVSVVLLFSKLVDISPIVDTDTYDQYRFPPTHWIMMGLHGAGNYNSEDVAFTASFDTYADKQEAIKERISERIQELGIMGVISHEYKKASSYAWNYGTCFAERYLGDSGDPPLMRNLLHEFILTSGKYHKPFYAVTQGIWLLYFGLCAVGMLLGIRGRTKESLPIFVTQLSILGVMLFFMLWETHPRYTLQCMPIVILLASLVLDRAKSLLHCIPLHFKCAPYSSDLS